MKKTILIAIPMLVSVMAFQSCMKPADNSKMNATIDSLVNVRVMAFKDSLTKVCMSDVMTQAKMKADSMILAASKKSGGKTAPKKVAPPPPPPKKEGMQGLSDQSKQNSQGMKSLSNEAKKADTTKKKGMQGLSNPKPPK